MRDLETLAESVAAIANRAAQAILEVYADPQHTAAQLKADDSPVTLADLRAHALILQALQALTPELPVLSEEGALPPFAERRRWQEYWLVDPLDGTREFLSRNGEFTVNIALIREGVPVLGVVHAPVSGHCWMGIPGREAWKSVAGQHWQAIHTAPLNPALLRVLGSRRHGGDALQELLARLRPHFTQISLQSAGSSLKFCLLAEGLADFYPRLAPTSEWDTAAAQAVLVAAGGAVWQEDLQPLRCNGGESLTNPSFLAVADATADWRRLLG
jgi:3'(2'), 5'-bisphosphate nucleotidase